MQRDVDPLFEHALKLIIRQRGGTPEEATQATAELARWRALDFANEKAWRLAEARWAESSALGDLQARIPVPPATGERRTRNARRRRTAVTTLGIATAIACLAGTIDWYWRQPQYGDTLDTGRAQLLSRSFPDGSRVELSARTRLKVTYLRSRRTVELAHGEAAFDIRSDPDRPFVVDTPLGRVQVVGTSFTVGYFPGSPGVTERLSVAVATGRVRITTKDGDVATGATRPLSTATPSIELAPGQAVTVTAGAQPPSLGPIRAVKAEDVGDWRRGWFVFDGTPLEEAVARWNAFVDPPFVLGDSVARKGYRLTGAYPIRDPAAFLAGLAATFPVQLTRSNDATLIEAGGRPARR